MFDGKAFGQEVVAAVKAHVDKSLAPIIARLDALEKREAPVKPEDLEALNTDVESLRKAIADLPAPVEPPTIPDIPAMIAEAVAAIPAPENGKDADPEFVAAQVKEIAEAILAGWERPKDGKSVTVEELSPLLEALVSKAVAGIPVPKDGAAVAGGTIDRQGHLIITLDNGQTKDFGLVVGRDADEEAILSRLIEKMPAPVAAREEDHAPDDISDLITEAVKMCAGFVTKAIEPAVSPVATQPNITVHMPPVEVKMAEPPAPIVNVTVPEQAAPVVHVELPRKGKEVTRVTEWDKSGRIKAFEKTEE